MDPIRWGILSTGNIANQFAKGLQVMDDAELVAVGSRSQEKADEFGDKYNVPHRHGNYDDLANDPDVDAIYIASPHSHHHEHMMLCLNAGKHVLCEKAFTLTADEAEECINLAQEKGLFLMEAMWTRFLPGIVKLREWLAAGILGKIQYMRIEFSFKGNYNPQHRLWNPALGGGSLLDLGVYNVAMASMVLGLPDSVDSHILKAPTGIDQQTTIFFKYNDGAVATLMSGFDASLPMQTLIVGDKGWARIEHRFYEGKQITRQIHGQDAEVFEFPFESTGYQFEAAEVNAGIRAGKLESDIMPLSETLALMKLMDGVRHEWGVLYPVEQQA
ncbi:MAG: Gfo/Idh/MocA family oxidoreductase [Anaerolineae bacterium]|nr:Gfo/Idh/MocA family oxidoreductase [Anaerolineae bacterium]MCA9888344.1 Gfo/Idh/MocA family oxidoreductase [Anaerolineae bacterium]